MKLENEKRFRLAVLCNAGIVVFELIGLYFSAREYGWGLFEFYTQDSNLLTLLVSIAFLIGSWRNWKNKEYKIPKGIGIMRYVSTCSLVLTFIIALFVLAPADGLDGLIWMFFSGTMLCHHLLCPILSFLSYVLIEGPEYGLTRRCAYIAVIPTALYAAVMLILNIALVVLGPYFFLRVYEQAGYMSVVWCIVILVGAYVIAYWVWKFGRKR